MRNIINLIYKFRHIGVFIGLEIFCFRVNNFYRLYGNQFLTFQTGITDSLEAKITEIKNLFYIKSRSEILLEENRYLHALIAHYEHNVSYPISNTGDYVLLTARVVNNSIIYARNYITLDKGSENGIEPGMGVFCNSGIIGKVVMVSKHFATVISILNVDMWFSAEVKDSGAIGSIRWDGNNASKVSLMYISRHLSPKLGDEVVTSGYGDAFYKGIPIGRISYVHLNKNDAFYEIDVDLSTRIYSIGYVYIIKKNKLAEQLLIEANTKKLYE